MKIQFAHNQTERRIDTQMLDTLLQRRLRHLADVRVKAVPGAIVIDVTAHDHDSIGEVCQKVADALK